MNYRTAINIGREKKRIKVTKLNLLINFHLIHINTIKKKII